MINIEKYSWFIYKGRPITLSTDHPEFDVDMAKDGKFGYRKIGSYHYLVLRSELDIRFKIKDTHASRILRNSIGWKGKIKGVTVKAGVGGKDKKKETVKDDKDIYRLEIDSSNLKEAWYDKKEKELHVVFHSEAHWVYEEVSLAMAKNLEKAESQGRYFIYRIRDVKPQRQIKG